LHIITNYCDIKTIDIDKADIDELNLIIKCKNLIVLNVHSCIAPNFLYMVSINCNKLEFLRLCKDDNDNSHKMSPEIKNLKDLRHLELINFNFGNFPIELSFLNNLEYLKIFSCDYNIDISVIYKIKNLKYLILSDVWSFDNRIIYLKKLVGIRTYTFNCTVPKYIYKLPQLSFIDLGLDLYDDYQILNYSKVEKIQHHQSDIYCNKITLFDSKSINRISNEDISDLVKNDEMIIMAIEYSKDWSPTIPNNIKKLRILSSGSNRELFDLSNLPTCLEYIEFNFNLLQMGQYNFNNLPFNVNTIKINIGDVFNNTIIKYYNYEIMPTINHPIIDSINKTKDELLKYIDTLRVPYGCKIIINDMNKL